MRIEPCAPPAASLLLAKFPHKNRPPALPRHIKIPARLVVGNAVEHVLLARGDLLLVGLGERAPQRAHVRDAVDAAAQRIDAQDAQGHEHVAVELALGELQFVQSLNIARLVGLDLHLARDREGFRIGEIERRAAVAENQAAAVVGEPPAFARVLHRALELAGEVVDEHVVLGPGELEQLAVHDGQALAEIARPIVAQLRHLAVGCDGVEAGVIAHRAGALVELAVVPFEPLREADLAAHDLVGHLEAQRGGAPALGRVCGSRQRDECEQASEHAWFSTSARHPRPRSASRHETTCTGVYVQHEATLCRWICSGSTWLPLGETYNCTFYSIFPCIYCAEHCSRQAGADKPGICRCPLRPEVLMSLIRMNFRNLTLYEDEEWGSTHMALYVTVRDNVGATVGTFRWNNAGGEVDETDTYALDNDPSNPNVIDVVTD